MPAAATTLPSQRTNDPSTRELWGCWIPVNVVQPPASAVLIIGTGPAGLFAACDLLRHGVKPRIVERRFAPHGETRGTALQPAVLGVLARGGLIEPFLRAGVRIRHIQLLGPGLREIGTANFEDIGCDYEFQCSLPQWRTEAILHEHLECLGLVIEYGTDVRSIEDHPAGPRVTLRRRHNGSPHHGLRAGCRRCPQRDAPFDAGAS